MEDDNTSTESRPCRDATKVTDFKAYHVRGEAAIKKIETPTKGTEEEPDPHRSPKARKSLNPHNSDMAEIEKLKEALESQRALNDQMKQDLEAAQLKAQLEREKRRQKELEISHKQLEEEELAAQRAHEEAIAKTTAPPAEQPPAPTTGNEALIKMLQEKINQLKRNSS